jgi:hypothetical protein
MTYTLVTKTNYGEYKDYLEEIEAFYFGRDPVFLNQAIVDGSVVLLIYHHPKLGMIGGAKIVHPDHSHPVNQYFQELGYIIEEGLVIEDVFFHIPDESPVHEDEEQFGTICREFYSGLHEVIQMHAQDNNLSALLTLNSSDEHEDIKFFGGWPFRFEHNVEAECPNQDKTFAIIPVIRSDGSRA